MADSLAQACHSTPTAAAAALVASGEASLRATQEHAERQRHHAELATSRARARRAVVVAALVLLVAIVVLVASVI